jgi:DNA repair protein RadC
MFKPKTNLIPNESKCLLQPLANDLRQQELNLAALPKKKLRNDGNSQLIHCRTGKSKGERQEAQHSHILKEFCRKSNEKPRSIKEIKVISVREVTNQYEPMDNPAKLVDFWNKEVVKSLWFDSEKEALVVFSLDSKLMIKTFNLVTLGLINQTLVHCREVYRPAIASAACHVVIIHNHPSGVPAPSPDDIRASREIKDAGKVLGIPCVDSIVVGVESKEFPRGFVSLKESGLMA